MSGSDVALIIIRPVATPAACLRHTKVSDQLSWNFDGGETKKYQVPRFADENAKKGGFESRRVRYCRWERGICVPWHYRAQCLFLVLHSQVIKEHRSSPTASQTSKQYTCAGLRLYLRHGMFRNIVQLKVQLHYMNQFQHTVLQGMLLYYLWYQVSSTNKSCPTTRT